MTTAQALCLEKSQETMLEAAARWELEGDMANANELCRLIVRVKGRLDAHVQREQQRITFVYLPIKGQA